MSDFINLLANIIIPVFGTLAFAMSQTSNPVLRKYAPILGLSAQPFWFYTQWTSANFGVILICFLYTGIWMFSFYLQWVTLPRKKALEAKETESKLESMLEVSTKELITNVCGIVEQGKAQNRNIAWIEKKVSQEFRRFCRDNSELAVSYAALSLTLELSKQQSSKPVCPMAHEST